MRLTLCVLFALSACKPTRAQLDAHPARQLETFGGVPETPLEERVVHPIPEMVLDYIRKDNALQGYRERPRPAEIDEALLDDLRAAVREMPEVVKRLVTSKLVAIYPVAELGGTAYTESVRRGKDRQAGAWVLLDASVLNRPANAWATWKENSPFVSDPDYRIEAIIEAPENDNRKSALQYILLHELGHIAPFGRGIVPHWSRPKSVDTGRYTFFEMSWRVRDGKFVTLFDEAFPARGDVHYYVPEKRLPAARALKLYESLEVTNFASLYGLTHYLDDFAEGFVTYVHTVLQRRPFEVRLYEGAKLRKTYRACWEEPRCAEKRAVFEELPKANPERSSR